MNINNNVNDKKNIVYIIADYLMRNFSVFVILKLYNIFIL